MTEPDLLSLVRSYLTPRLLLIWDLRRGGALQTDIAIKLGISRQAVNQALEVATGKVTKALTEAATISKIDIQSVDSNNGRLTGWSREFSVKAVISIARRNGMQIWYEHVADCAHCHEYYACRAYLLGSAKGRGIRLTKEQKELAPSKLAQFLFGMREA